MWEAAPCNTLPTADENTVRVCICRPVFQLVPVSNSSYKACALVLLSLAEWNPEATGVANLMSGDSISVRIATLEEVDFVCQLQLITHTRCPVSCPAHST